MAVNLTSLATKSLGLTLALAWNNATKTMFGHFFGGVASPLAAMGHAMIVTLLIAIIVFMINHARNKPLEEGLQGPYPHFDVKRYLGSEIAEPGPIIKI